MKKKFNGKATVIIDGLSNPYAALLSQMIEVTAEADGISMEEAAKQVIVAAMHGIYSGSENGEHFLKNAIRQHGGNPLGYYDDKDNQWRIDLVNNTIEFT